MSKFSFLLPAYKSSFLKEALSSILNQTFKDFDVIVSDDCSPEPLKDIVDSFSDHTNLHYRRNETNIGGADLVDHWNLLLSLSDSDFIIIAGDDDRYDSHFLDEINSLTEEHPEVDLFCTGLNIIDASGAIKKTYSGSSGLISFNSFVDHLLDPRAILCMGNFVFRRSSLMEKGGFVSFPLAWKSDSASQIAVAGNGVASSSKVLFDFRMSGSNLSSRIKPDLAKDSKKLASILQFDQWMEENGYPSVSEETRRSVRRKLEGEIRTYLWSMNLSGRFNIFRKLRREGWFYNFKNKISFLRCVFISE